MDRIVGIQHRVKRTADGEERPTRVCILSEGNEPVCYELPDEQAEMDFIFGCFPTIYRAVNPDENLSVFEAHHLVYEKDDGKSDRKTERKAIKVPAAYAGLREGDLVAMILGGSGDRLAYAMSRHGERIGATVVRITPSEFKANRGGGDKDEDAQLLARLAQQKPDLFWPCTIRDRKVIRLREFYYAREDVMKARIACEQRLRSRHIGTVFMADKDLYPEGRIEDSFDALKASDAILSGLMAEEEAREKDFKKAVRRTDVYKTVFSQVNGFGEAMAARLVAAIGDIRRFRSESAFEAFLGLHVPVEADDEENAGKRIVRKLRHGEKAADFKPAFARRRHGTLASWHPDGRQAMYLFGDQIRVYKRGGRWREMYEHYQQVFRAKHPEMCKNCGVPWAQCGKKGHKRLFSQGHINKMALWRTLSRFARWVYREWWKLEQGERAKLAPTATETRATGTEG